MFQTLKETLAAAALVALTATTATADQPIYGNVTARDLVTLLSGQVVVRHAAGSDRHDASVMTLQVSFFGADGVIKSCKAFDGYVDGKAAEIGWKPIIVDDKTNRERYPLIEFTAVDGPAYALYQYDAAAGKLDVYASGGRWKLHSTGHIQSDIPAAIYTMCPDFPSAESLGTTVNTKQTSTNYRAMVAQDPGQRVLRPDLVTEVTVEKY